MVSKADEEKRALAEKDKLKKASHDFKKIARQKIATNAETAENGPDGAQDLQVLPGDFTGTHTAEPVSMPQVTFK